MLFDSLKHLVVFDTETTGIDYEEVRVVTAYIGVMSTDGAIEREWEFIIDPGVEVPEGAAKVHGWTNERLAADPRTRKDADKALAEIIEVLARETADGSPIVAYNGRYDMTLMHFEALRFGIKPMGKFDLIDPYVIDKKVDKFRKGGRKLIDTAKLYGVELSDEDAHAADFDAKAAGLVALALLPIVRRKYKIDDTSWLHREQVRWAEQQATSFEEYKRARGDVEFIEKIWPVAPTRAGHVKRGETVNGKPFAGPFAPDEAPADAFEDMPVFDESQFASMTQDQTPPPLDDGYEEPAPVHAETPAPAAAPTATAVAATVVAVAVLDEDYRDFFFDNPSVF